jgi:hypothetical protein
MIEYKDYLFFVAPVTDWIESIIPSIGWKAACAGCVHREFKKNLVTANISKPFEVEMRAPSGRAGADKNFPRAGNTCE